jgi:Dyp-type peroxidase family
MKLKEKNRTAPTTTAGADAAPGTERVAAFKIGDGGAPFLPEAVQSNVIRSVNPQQARYIFFQIANPDAFRRFIGNLLDPAKADPNESGDFFGLPADMRKLWSEGWAHSYDEYNQRSVKPLTWNIAFTWTGLQALGINADTLASFPEDFREGMAARAKRLGDVGDSAPETWEGWLGNRAIHGMLQISIQPQAQSPAAEEPGRAIVEFLVRAFNVFGLRILHTENGERIPAPWNKEHRIEHFGFRDGISQPFAEADLGTPKPPPPGGGTARPGGTWDPIALGELLLGYPDEDGLMQARPANSTLRLNGTYMVFRKLEQDVVGFRRYLREQTGHYGPDSLLAAQMMGRWPDGTSLVDATVWPTQQRDERALNDFRYSEDPRGQRCPMASHARRVNPRDSNDRDEARRHRIWRRSLTYGGDFLPYDSPGDGKSRGLLFIALCGRLDQQFEFLQTRWLNTGEFIGQAGIGRCPITGANRGDIEDSFPVPGRPAPYSHLPRFVRVRGGDYFFVPSLPALSGIAKGEKFCSDPEPAVNPSLDQTPKPVDSARLVKLGVDKLLPQDSDAFLSIDGLVLVGRQKYVRRVLEDDRRFALSDMDRRMRQICGGERLMLGMPSVDPERELRMRLWRDAAHLYTGPSVAAIAQQTMQRVLRRHGAKGSLDIVRNVSLVVPSALAQVYFGVPGPDWVSPTYVASQFAKLEIAQVPPDWLASLPHAQPQDVPFITLQSWAQTAFAHVFTNVVNAAELTATAQRSTAEFFRHLDSLVAQARARPNKVTLLGCLMSLDPATYKIEPDRYPIIVRLLLAELIVGSSGTLSQALPNFIDYLLQHPDIVDPAARYTDDELDGIIREALRFEPVAPILFRRCTMDSILRGKTIPANSPIAVLLKTAMFDQRKFGDPDTFSAQRPADGYLVFGAGLHECKGADIGTAALREMVRALLTLKDLHGAAGPEASNRDALARWTKFVVRFEPVAG